MRLPSSWLRNRALPVALVLLATVLTAPWTFWVIHTAYNRHVLENAKMLARRVELRVEVAPGRWLSSEQAATALQTELESDPTVVLAYFYDLNNGPVCWWRRDDPNVSVPEWSQDDIIRLASGPVTSVDNGPYVDITIPWVQNGRALGFTYLELSRQELSTTFWENDGALLRRVIGLTTAAVAFLSALGILAYQAMQNAGKVAQRAELTRQGMLAERGLTAAVLAHEIRNPLAALRFQLHNLRRNAADAQRVGTTADTIDSELLRIQQLVSDYLEHERATSMRVRNVELAPAAHDLQLLMTDLLRQSHVQLTVLAPPAPVIAVCDSHALRQVLMNLVINAQQAIERTREEARREARQQNLPPPIGQSDGSIVIRIGASDGYATIDVADNGPGIPMEMRERLFKPFQTTREEGHGIGLALARRFVDNFGGSIRVDSTPGKGTTFHLRLPLAGSRDAAYIPSPTAAEANQDALPLLSAAAKNNSPGGEDAAATMRR